MSWVQQPQIPPQQQQQQQQQHGVAAPVHPTPPAMNTNAFLGKSNSNSSAAGALPIHPSQQQQQHPHAQQGHFSNQSQQLQQWQQQPQNYLQHSKMMQPNVASNWQRQNVANTDMYQQHAAAAATTNNWQQPELQAAPIEPQQQQPQQQQQPPTLYDNYYAQAATQQQPAPQQPQAIQQQQHNQQNQQHDSVTFFQPQPHQQQQLAASAQDIFDNNVSNNSNNNISMNSTSSNTNNTNNNSKTDGWGDWDWNDTNSSGTNEMHRQHLHERSLQQQPPQQQHQQQQQQSMYNAANIIADSFGTQVANDSNWQWGASNDDVNANSSQDPTVIEPHQQPPLAPQVDSFQVPPPLPTMQQLPTVADFAGSISKQTNQIEILAHAAAFGANVAAKPTSLPLLLPEASNENYNNLVASAGASQPPQIVAPPSSVNNIPNSVYVSQAKRVARPPRQYASPPGGSTPTADTPENTITPPQGFQNEIPPLLPPAMAAMETKMVAPAAMMPPAAVQTPPLPPPSVALLLPPVGTGATPAGNPFKRAGVPQHHRAGLMPTTTAIQGVPPPPVDFATLSPIMGVVNNPNLMPDNSEALHENQEVIAPPLLTPAPASSPPASQSQPTTNNERYQYLQTSHLSENPDEELNNVEAAGGDSLPPPGLSRLVLGEPELDATSTLRMVTGTEEPPISIAVQNMHIEERHADGEDNSTDQQQQAVVMNAAPRGALAGSSNAIALLDSSANQIDITADRSLYQVPGESNANNEQRQRVVTGVETDEEPSPNTITTNATPLQHAQIISGQREIELDGENLEDQQQQQMQHQQPIAAVTQRNDLPLEGAAAHPDVPLPQATTVEAAETHQQHQQHHAKAKDHQHSNISTGNDESDPPAQESSSRHSRLYSGGNKKTDKKRVESATAASATESAIGKQRRNDKLRSSVERYDESEDDSGAEYSSDRERERRRRDYREGSVRSERDRNERGEREEFFKEKRRREKRESGEKTRGNNDSKYYYRESDKKPERGSDRRTQRYNPRGGYDLDAKYETEESTARHELNLSRKEQSRRSMRAHPAADERGGGGRSDRSDRDYDEYRGRGTTVSYRGSKREKVGAGIVDPDRERRQRRDRDDYEPNTLERRRRNDKRQSGGGGHADYEEYRKQSSRNARESDMEKERGVRDPRYDSRHAAAAYASGYHAHQHHHPSTAGAYGYDPYAYYYEQMARTNPQAYAEWYKKYYGHAAASSVGVSSGGPHIGGAEQQLMTGGSSSLAATDGRESVHSGRSSAHNEKERYTHAYISQANEYHRHFHHHQHQQQQQQLTSIHHNMSLNSAMLEGSMSASAYAYSGGVLRGARSTSNLSQIHSTSIAAGGGINCASYYAVPERAYYARSEYADSRSGNLSLRDAEPIIADDPQRLTPCKFVNEHAVVSLSSGILVTVKPKYTHGGHNISNIVKLQRLGANDATRQLFQAFPGPLVRGLTHKKTIIEFCEEQIRLGPMQTTIYAKQLLSPTSNSEKYGASYTLMWNLLILLLRQNGMVVGTDIAELLLKNQQNFPYRTHTPNSSGANSLKMTRSKSGSETPDASEDDNNEQEKLSDDVGDDEQPKSSTTTIGENHLTTVSPKSDQDSSLSATAKSLSSATLTETKVTEKFRNYLLYGNVNEALDWATDNNLWGHALFLASKVDRRSHANVMMKFANKLSLNDPLQTLYQLMSGRTPSSVTSVQDEKWGDWRPHLSMILSNTSQKPELDRKAITTLGDSLFNRGDLFAAHFCYLMAQVGFGRYQECAAQESALQQNLSKLVLLGSSHYKTFRDFASNEAIMMTEIYEYACSLNDEKFSLVEFQPYKYLLATRLLDYGCHLKSLMYMEQIAMHIQRDPSKYEPSFINKIYDFGDRLKYYDPVLEKTMDDQLPQTDGSLNGMLPQFEEQKWLQDLRVIAAQQGNLAYAPPTYTPASGADQQENNYRLQNQIDQEFTEINKQFNELNLQYSSNSNSNNAEPPSFYNPDSMQQQQQQPSPQLPTATEAAAAESNELYTQQQHQPIQTEYAHQQQQPHHQATVADDSAVVTPTASTNAVDPYANYAQQQQHYLQPDQNSYYDPTQQQPLYNHAEASDVQNSAGAGYADYDYWALQQQQQLGEENTAPRPTITLPKSRAYDSEGETQQQRGQTDNQAKKNAKNDAKEANKSAQQTNQNSGWFGGIWNKLSLKPKNQMILPDDKNPAIVWDPENKRWINTDGGDEATEESLKPPPKMSDLMPPQQHLQQQQHLPLMDTHQFAASPLPPTTAAAAAAGFPMQNFSATTAAATTTNDATTAAPKPPSLQSNMFKMQRNRTLKNSYVDVFNPSGAPMSKAAESVMAPALPPAAVPHGGFFIPGAAPAAVGIDAAAAYQQQQLQQVPQQDVPQFYNPNQYGRAAY